MKSDNHSLLINFFENWKVELLEIMKISYFNELNYSKNDYGITHLLRVPARKTTKKQDQNSLHSITTLERDFVRICSKRGILKRYLFLKHSKKDYDYVGDGQSEWHPYAKEADAETIKQCRKFYLFLSKEKRMILKNIKRNPIRRKPRVRIPSLVAKKMLEILVLFSGNKEALTILRDFLGNPNQLLASEERLFRNVRRAIIEEVLHEKLSISKNNLLKYKDPKTRRKIIKRKLETIDEINRIKDYELKWKLSGYRGNNNGTQWANHLKEHLFRIILSGKEQKVIKKLNHKQHKERGELLQAIKKDIETICSSLPQIS